MVQNPKYDNDAVNLGYLNKRLGQTEESINKNNDSISQLPKNYSIPPNPPYYKDSLLCYKNKIYKCNTTKLNGVFSWNDWTIAATDDTTLSDFINNTYELEKLEIQEQIDGKVQTYYQEMDPSNEWTTDLEKSKHIGDYWYNTTNNTQWRYNRNTTTTPITYGWGQVNVPNSVFDLIDKKKSIYTIKPTSYKKDDLWIIEDTLSDEDLPTGTEDNPIAKGDWVFSVADSDTYNKEHWIKRDEDISLSYLEQHYYTIGDIDSSFEELERNTDSKITKAKEEISLNVSQTYTTKEEHTKAINDFDKQIGTINDTITTHETNISNLNVGVGKISASVESIESKTEELSVDIDGVKENIIPTSTVSGPNIHIEDASDKKMVNFEIEGKSEQATSTQSANLCPPFTDSRWTFINGASVTSEGYLSIPATTGARATITIPWNKSRTCYFKGIIVSGGNAHYNGAYFDATGTQLSGNGKAIVDKDANYQDETMWGGDNQYGDALTQTTSIKFTIQFSSYTPNPYVIKDLIISENDINYIPFTPNMPSPDYPSEIESVGYENLFNKLMSNYTSFSNTITIDSVSDNSITLTISSTGGPYDTVRYYSVADLVVGKTYTVSANIVGNDNSLIRLVKNNSGGGSDILGYVRNNNSFTFTYDGSYNSLGLFLYISHGVQPTEDLTATFSNIQIEEGSQSHPYISYGKYGIEVETVGKNLLNGINPKEVNYATPTIEDNILAISSSATNTLPYVTYEFDNVKLNDIFSVNSILLDTNCQLLFQIYINNAWVTLQNSFLKYIDGKTVSKYSYKIVDGVTKIKCLIYSSYTIPTGNTIARYQDIIITKNNEDMTYQPYQENKSLFVLNAPLRSLPNGVKDIAYIKNNILYVDRKVGTVVLNGSERWYMDKELTNTVRFYTSEILTNKAKQAQPILSNYFITATSVNNINNDDNESAYVLNTTQPAIRINKSIANTLTTFKNWLSTNNTQVDYELAEPYAEKIGEVEIPSTFKGVNNITTTDELEPVMNIEYVRDTILSDYVEGQVGNAVAIQERKNAEFQITNEEIKSSVSNISTDLDGTKSSLNSVEEKITSQEKTINIISKNIDGSTGDIREVTTTTGFTFNAEGLTIDDGAGYKAQHTAQGTFYKDGTSIVGQYTKDGSKQKDLELFGTYSYGKNDINDTPMFVAQLYTDEKGEECFGHFLNIQ